MNGGDSQAWIARLGPARQAKVRLLCIPQAGGGTATFRPLAPALPEEIELCALRLPGRENRRREPAVRAMPELLETVVSALDDYKDLPLAVFGYCSGAVVAFDLVRELIRTGRPAPVRLIACAGPGPQVINRRLDVHRMTPDALVDYLRRFSVTPESILTDETLFGIFEPAIRADFQVYETHPYQAGAPLDLPITVIGARDDTTVAFDELLAWRELTAREFSVRMLPGPHSFFTATTASLGRALARELLIDDV